MYTILFLHASSLNSHDASLHRSLPLQSFTDPDVYIDAPSEQFAILNDNITLLCEPSDPAHEAVVSWLRNGSIASSQLLSVSLEDEGTYTCSAYFFELGPSFDNQVELKVLSKLVCCLITRLL